MKPKPIVVAGAIALVLPHLKAAQAELDFNDLLLGDTRTQTNAASPNNGNLNTGSGFADFAGGGEFDNNTGVLLFISPDIPVPTSVTNFVSDQGPDVNEGAGVCISSSNGSRFRRMQERAFTSALTGSDIYFSFLTRIKGPDSEIQLVFNVPKTTESTVGTQAFAVAVGDDGAPGAVAILGPTTGEAAALLQAPGNPQPGNLYYEDLNADGLIDPGEDTDGNGVLNGIDYSDEAGHVIIGRVQVDVSGTDDQIDVWLDPANALDLASLGAPTITLTADVINSATGIFSVGFEGVRDVAAVGNDGNGNYTDGGRGDIDHFRISDGADALGFVTGNLLPDPTLDIAGDSPDLNFSFGTVFGTGNPVASPSRTVKLVNNGLTEDIVINTIAFENGNADGVFTITSQPSLPLTLAPGASTTVTMTASSGIFDQAFSENLVIDTDEDTVENPQDRVIGVGATFYTSGSKVNDNPGFESGLANWLDDDFNAPINRPVQVSPGFNGSASMARVKGIGDVAGSTLNNFSQTVPRGAGDWELTFQMANVPSADFANYAGFSALSPDRSFQIIIQGDQNIPTHAAGTEGQWGDTVNADGSMINLIYDAEADDFALYNGATGQWDLLNLGPIAGSVDRKNPPLVTTDSDGDGIDDSWEDDFFGDGIDPAEPAELAFANNTGSNNDIDGADDLTEFLNGTNPLIPDTDSDGIDDDVDIPGDGRLDPANPNDTVNAYLIRIKGTGFGTPSASYSISISDANATNAAVSVTGLTTFEALDITDHTVGAYTFTTGDVSTNSGGGFATSFWIDNVCYWADEAREPVIGVSNMPTIFAHNATTGVGTVTISNGGFTENLTITGLSFGGSVFSTTQTLPLVIGPGSSAEIAIDFNGSNIPAPDNAHRDVLTITSDDILQPTATVGLLGAVTSDSNLLGNWNFEVAGNNPDTDTDTFAIWAEGVTPANAVDAAGLVAGSATSMQFVGNSAEVEGILGAAAANFQIEFPFVATSGGDRIFSMQLRVAGGSGDEEVNMRINTAGVFQCFNGAWTDIPGMPNYLGSGVASMRVTGFNWGTASASLGFEVLDASGTSLGSSGQVTNLFRDVAQTALNGLGSIRFLSSFGAPRFTVDDVLAQVIVPQADLAITGVSRAANGDFTIGFTGAAATTYRVQSSPDLQAAFTDIDGGALTATTDGGGVGSVTVPAALAGSGRNFFRISE